MLPNNRVIFDMNSRSRFDFWFTPRFNPKDKDLHLYTRPIDPSRKLAGWTTGELNTWHLFPLPEIAIKFFKEFRSEISK